jgi:hypothetical protein
MSIWVAYNACGDLVADGYTYAELMASIAQAGYYDDEVMIGKVTP